MDLETIKGEVRNYLKEHVFHGDDSQLDDSTALISSGMVDSITTLQMVDHLEAAFKVEFEAHEVDQDNLDTITKIAEFVLAKLN